MDHGAEQYAWAYVEERRHEVRRSRRGRRVVAERRLSRRAERAAASARVAAARSL